MEMIYSLLVFVIVAAIKISRTERISDVACVCEDCARDLRRERRINPRQIGCCGRLVC